MEGIHVRAARATDAPDISAINAAPSVIHNTLQMPYQSAELWQQRLSNMRPGTQHLVAELDGRVVGSLGLHVEQSPRRRHSASLGMSVHPDFQGRGIGTALLGSALDLTDNWLNLHRVELEVYIDNEPAIRLYEKHGFTIEGTLHDYAFRDGSYVDAYYMARLKPETNRG